MGKKERVSKTEKAQGSRTYLEETTCAHCSRKIEKWEYRVVVTMVEMQSDPPGRGASHSQSYCDVCRAELPHFEIANVLFAGLLAAAAALSQPQGQDALDRAITAGGKTRTIASVAEKRAGRARQQGNDGGEGLADEIAEEMLTTGTQYDREIRPEPPTENDIRSLMRAFLKTPMARKMRPQLLEVAGKWADGSTQAQIAGLLRLSQPTVSRLIHQAKSFLYRSKA